MLIRLFILQVYAPIVHVAVEAADTDETYGAYAAAEKYFYSYK